LRNEIYLGKVRYQETRRNADGKRNFSAPIQWFDGQHEAIIDRELFDKCQLVRTERAGHRQAVTHYNAYLLRGLVYCHRCCTNPVANTDFPSWGKMFCQKRQENHQSYYRCGAKAAGFLCDQGESVSKQLTIKFTTFSLNLSRRMTGAIASSIQ